MSKRNKTIIVSVITVITLLLAAASWALFMQQNNGNKVISTYTACGCGVCGGYETKPEFKYYSKSRGEEDSYNSAVQRDKTVAQSSSCEVAGCALAPCIKLILTE